MDPAFVLVLLLLALGYLARRTERLPEYSSDALNRFVIDLCVPAALLRLIPTLRFEWTYVALAIVPWLLAALAYGMVRLLATALALDRSTRAALFICTALGNTSFLGYPLCSALLGEGALPLAAVYDQLGTFLLLSTVVPITIASASGGARPDVRDIVKRVVTFPPFVALLVALLPLPRPPWLDVVLQQLASPLVPLALFAVGLRLRITPPRERAAFGLGLALKLVLLPAISWGLAAALAAPPAVRDVTVLESAMPAMITGGAMLMAAGLAPELTAALVGWGVVVSLVTVPLWAALLRAIA